MKTKLMALLCFLLFTGSVQAQLLWDKTYGTPTTTQNLNRMIPLSNGDYLLVGGQYTPTSNGGAINRSTLTIRTNSNGDTIWTRKYPLAGLYGSILDAAQDHDGNLILVGTAIKGTPSDYDGFIMKLNPSGDTIWTKKAASPLSDGYFNIIIGNDSTYILNCEESANSVIKKINKNGSTVWSRIVNFSPTVQGLNSNLSKTQGGYFVFSGNRTVYPNQGK